jgi:hypothetical protein
MDRLANPIDLLAKDIDIVENLAQYLATRRRQQWSARAHLLQLGLFNHEGLRLVVSSMGPQLGHLAR